MVLDQLSVTGIAYDRAGTGSALLLIHGLGSDRHVWDSVVDELRSHFDVIAIDLPGHGRSTRVRPGQDVTPVGLAHSCATLLDELGLSQVDVAGSSLGGWVAIELALQSRARSVTAMAPAGFWRDGLVPVVAHTNRWLARLVSPIAAPLLRLQALRAIGFWSSSARPAELDVELTVHATNSLANATGWAAALAATHHRRCSALSLSPTVPLTVVWGDSDRILPAAYCQEPDGLPAHARWIRLSSCGHVPMWDQPDKSVQLILDTVRSATAGASGTDSQWA
jgi:pimeloyl-ACP methyl ester carboxylesterase